jgi:hypothetical protein
MEKIPEYCSFSSAQIEPATITAFIATEAVELAKKLPSRFVKKAKAS